MDTMVYMQLLSFSTPMFSALVCSALCFMYYKQTDDELQKKISRLLGTALVIASVCWLCAVLYISDYKLFIYFNTVFFLVLMFDQVLLYRFVFGITSAGNRRKFRKAHYAIPIIFCIIVGICTSTIPYKLRYELVMNRGFMIHDYPITSLLFSSFCVIFCIYNITYSILALRRANEYRREVINYSADTQKASVGWIYLFISLTLLCIPIPLATVFIHKKMVITSPLLIIGAILPLIRYVIICYNLLSGNYVIIESSGNDTEEQLAKESVISRQKFEKYIKDKKPYLDSKLKITDMCSALGTNRTYLSAFINREYGMNFSRYINRLRLKELDYMRINPTYAGLNAMELIQQAGFSSYRSYVRTKKMEDEASIIAMP